MVILQQFWLICFSTFYLCSFNREIWGKNNLFFTVVQNGEKGSPPSHPARRLHTRWYFLCPHHRTAAHTQSNKRERQKKKPNEKALSSDYKVSRIEGSEVFQFLYYFQLLVIEGCLTIERKILCGSLKWTLRYTDYYAY